ncbi:MAG: PilN domain-containing protein [Phycisphaerales bacterium]|jgi:Tfp pilus assembly protein PilN
MNTLMKSPGAPRNSFLPEDYVAGKMETRANILVLTLFAIVLGSVLGAFVVTNKAVSALNARKARVNESVRLAGQKIDQVKSLENQRAQMMDKAEITSALIERVPRWAVVGEIALRAPKEMRLETLQIKSTRIDPPKPPPPAITPQTTVKSLTAKVTGKPVKEPERPKPQAPRFKYALTIEGSAVKNNDVADFLGGLKQSPTLEDVEMAYIREAKIGETVVRQFQITAKVKNDVDGEMLSASLKKLMTDRMALLGETPDDAPKDNKTSTPGKQTADVPEKESK